MLRCRSVSVRFGDTVALANVDFDVGDEVVALMGESGSGKSTLLRVVAGLVTADEGRISWRGADLAAVPTHRRSFGLMFQDYALFPHLDVRGNIAFGLRMQNHSDSEQRARVDELLELVGLEGYAQRRISELSGGERQRVALARTLAPRPQLVLLDEPLGALDRARRDQLLGDMQRIFAAVGVAAVYVTHDHNEAFAFSDRVAVLDHGRKVADAPPARLWSNPDHPAVATLLGFPILRAIRVVGGRARVGTGEVAVDLTDGTHDLAVPPRTLTIVTDGPLDVDVVARRFEEGTTIAVARLMDTEIAAVAPTDIALGPARARLDGSCLVPVTAD